VQGETIQQMIIRTQQEINMKERELQIKIVRQEL
jgi:predicted RNA-binding protein Jag